MLIEWSDKYATGVEAIDRQHQEIFNQLNRLHDAITSGLGMEVVEDILEFARDYAEQHFAFEESCMEQYRCPVAAENKAAHRSFIDGIERIQQEIERNGDEPGAVLALYRELREWIQNHILKIDTQLRSCSRSHAGNEPS